MAKDSPDPKPRFRPQDPLSKWMRARHAAAGERLREAAPRLRKAHAEMNGVELQPHGPSADPEAVRAFEALRGASKKERPD